MDKTDKILSYNTRNESFFLNRQQGGGSDVEWCLIGQTFFAF